MGKSRERHEAVDKMDGVTYTGKHRLDAPPHWDGPRDDTGYRARHGDDAPKPRTTELGK